MNKPRPSGELKERMGEPQSAIDGLWRDEALIQFTDGERAEISLFEKRMNAMLKGRWLFFTHNGLMGVGPRIDFSEVGCEYEVHVVKGAKVPYVMAKAADGRYRLVGEAYLHGVMNGSVPGTMWHQEWCKYEEVTLI